jgi:hypothetical protein
MSVYVYAGVLNYETVYHTSSIFGIRYASSMKFIFNKFKGTLGCRMMIEVFLFLSVFDK